ncbi:hypothetical protein KQ945_09315 [Bacillus subtilis subsp. subtilis]|nr:hypothetical protein [Bacillus subtilis subsp. subtilis]
MLKGLKWVGMTVLGMGAMVVLVLLVSWWLPVPADQRDALQAADAGLPEGRPERNAFPAIWLLPYDGLSPAQVQALTEEDARRFAQALAGTPPQAAGNSVAEARFAKVTAATGWCRRGPTRCLEEVRANADAVAQAHQGHQALHARIAALGDADHYHSLFQPDPVMPFPPMQVLMERTSAHALAQVRGDSAQALQGACEDIRTGRMLMARSDSVLVAMVGGALAERSASLFTDVLAELPADASVPALCRQALSAPVVADLDLCLPMRGEFAFQRAATAKSPEAQRQWLYNERKTEARGAWQLSRTCSADVHAQIGEDRRVQLPPPPSIWSWSCAANALGCTLLDISAPAYNDYPRRAQDAGAQLRMAAAMLWLHAQPRGDADAMTRLADLPDALRSTQRPLQLTRDGRSVQVMRYGSAPDGTSTWVRAPLPQAWQPR